jgi:hypothetical protein
LEVIDLVYEAAWAHIEAVDPFRDTDKDDERKDALRKLVMDKAGTDKVDFDTLSERVLGSIPDIMPAFTEPANSPATGSEAS